MEVGAMAYSNARATTDARCLCTTAQRSSKLIAAHCEIFGGEGRLSAARPSAVAIDREVHVIRRTSKKYSAVRRIYRTQRSSTSSSTLT
jgi:hypothetical protein